MTTATAWTHQRHVQQQHAVFTETARTEEGDDVAEEDEGPAFVAEAEKFLVSQEEGMEACEIRRKAYMSLMMRVDAPVGGEDSRMISSVKGPPATETPPAEEPPGGAWGHSSWRDAPSCRSRI
jgi:hypothetical protein